MDEWTPLGRHDSVTSVSDGGINKKVVYQNCIKNPTLQDTDSGLFTGCTGYENAFNISGSTDLEQICFRAYQSATGKCGDAGV